jgi:hypothetical protein
MGGTLRRTMETEGWALTATDLAQEDRCRHNGSVGRFIWKGAHSREELFPQGRK